MAKKSKKQNKQQGAVGGGVGFNTHIQFVMDRSGSMETIRDDSIGGFNSFMKEQRKLDVPATATYSQFDSVYEVVHRNVDLKDLPDLTRETMVPRNSTSLLDAIGQSIAITDEDLRDGKISEGSQIYFVIITDGGENTSHEFSRDSVFKMITEKTKAGWEFVYLGANQDAIATAHDYGMSSGNTMNYSADVKGVNMMYANVSRGMSNSRLYGAEATSANFFVDADREDDDALKSVVDDEALQKVVDSVTTANTLTKKRDGKRAA